MNNNTLQSRLTHSAQLVETALQDLLTDDPQPKEIVRPERLTQAMRYAVLNGGKRLRPFLVIESAALFDIAPQQALGAAMAVECIHCYSLVHDDLPAMDDDDFRRGKPTVHKAYDEAIAILVGDGLLTLAFDILAQSVTHNSAEIRSDLILELARASGLGGMVGGQHLDLDGEKADWNIDQISTMQAMKTGALIRSACAMGAILGNAPPEHRKALNDYGTLIGRAFQLADDILDVTASPQAMGKATAKDMDRGKATLVAHFGVEKARTMAQELVDAAKTELAEFGSKADILRHTADFIVNRQN